MAKQGMKRPERTEEKTHKKSDIVPEIQGTENRSNNSYSNNSYSNNSNNNYSNNNQSNTEC